MCLIFRLCSGNARKVYGNRQTSGDVDRNKPNQNFQRIGIRQISLSSEYEVYVIDGKVQKVGEGDS